MSGPITALVVSRLIFRVPQRLGRRGFALKQGYLCVIIVDELGQAVNL